jgi:hypothetical protein
VCDQKLIPNEHREREEHSKKGLSFHRKSGP